jgi:hypothetical protein
MPKQFGRAHRRHAAPPGAGLQSQSRNGGTQPCSLAAVVAHKRWAAAIIREMSL